MVCKSLKRSPVKSIKDPGSYRPRRRHRKKSPGRTTSAVIISTINKTIFTCKRRLSKLFSKLARISTPSSRYKGYHILKSGSKCHDQIIEKDTICRVLSFNERLPPLISPDKRTVFLDLDETLIHSKADPPPQKFDFVVRPKVDGETMNFYVLKRPGVDAFLEALGAKYEVVVFTAGLREYASLVLDRIDAKGLISHRLYRDSCKAIDGKYVKDLSEMGRDLGRVVIVDDNPNSYNYQPKNAIPVKPFIDDLGDSELEKLVAFFERCDCFEDMRDAVKEYFGSEGDLEAGGELTDFIIVLRSTEAVKTFCGYEHLSLGAGVSAAVGITGRAFEADLRTGDGGYAACYTYSCSKGAFVGCSLEGSIVTTRLKENYRFYGRQSISASDIVLGSLPRPPAAAILYRALVDLYQKLER